MGSWQKFFSPAGYIGAVILALLGLAPVNATQWIAAHVSPEVVSWISGDKGRWCFTVIAFLVLWDQRRRHLGRIEMQTEEARKQRPPALSLPTTQITDIAVYLRDRSAWGWKKRMELNLKQFVQDAVPAELRRAGRSGEVRYIGTEPNSAESHEINAGYWDSATLDDRRIWDIGNEFFSTTDTITTRYRSSQPGRGLYHYRFGRAPRDEVMKTWPPASAVLRMRVKIVLWLRRARHGFPATMRD